MEKQMRKMILDSIQPVFMGYTKKINDTFENTKAMKVWIRQIEATIEFIDGVPVDIKKVILKKIKK